MFRVLYERHLFILISDTFWRITFKTRTRVEEGRKGWEKGEEHELAIVITLNLRACAFFLTWRYPLCSLRKHQKNTTYGIHALPFSCCLQICWVSLISSTLPRWQNNNNSKYIFYQYCSVRLISAFMSLKFMGSMTTFWEPGLRSLSSTLLDKMLHRIFRQNKLVHSNHK